MKLDDKDYTILKLICENPHISYRAIGEAVGGISRQAVHSRCKRMRVVKPHASLLIGSRRIYDHGEILRLRLEEYLSTSQIAVRVGCSGTTVHDVLHAAGAPLPRSSYPMLFSEEWVRATLHRRVSKLAKEVGCHKVTIYRARHRFGLGSRRRKE